MFGGGFMKLAVEIWHTVYALGEEKALALLKKSGFDAVDYSFFWQDPTNSILDDNYLERAHKTKELLAQYDLVCNQAHAPYGNSTVKNPMDVSHPGYKDIVRSMEYASIIGAKHIVVHGLNNPIEFNEVNATAEYYRSFTPYIKQFGVKIAVENLPHSGRLNNPNRMNAALEQLDPDCFVALVDVGHANLQHYAPESFIRKILPGRLQGLHIHDNHGEKDEHILPYLGDIRWEYVLEALAEVNYSGDFTFELPGFIPKYAPNMLPEALSFVAGVGRKMMEQFQALMG